ncbi:MULTISPECIES: DJ-1/PfpI family protein [unclassified Janthinobacterium]|uniref:DJ-1/PfpI family protein n=1 Tax=unclassified Janthinobacterium TaxID=2610881 RepID=UPI0003462AC7|nr:MULTISPECIES: DJ-1/PfpI family protein [unclassified Janthinobacterium]MEC5162098.1 transcriptional regulator GlxA family with amidase domain [Janthinobacterium sp. CG_S6]
MQTVAILIFNDVEVLDFAGPFEVFGVTGGRGKRPLYDVFTVAQSLRPVMARNQLSINPDYSFETMPDADVFVVPGGFGTRREKRNPSVLRFLEERVAAARSVVSICSGALMLAKAGLLDGLHATTHRGALEELALDAPDCTIWPEARVVDNGKIVVSAGISMGIEASLYTVAKHHGQAQALETARYMEYDWQHHAVDGKHVVVPARLEQSTC